MAKVCVISNGALHWTMEVDGQTIIFYSSTVAKYFEELYSKMGYNVETRGYCYWKGSIKYNDARNPRYYCMRVPHCSYKSKKIQTVNGEIFLCRCEDKCVSQLQIECKDHRQSV